MIINFNPKHGAEYYSMEQSFRFAYGGPPEGYMLLMLSQEHPLNIILTQTYPLDMALSQEHPLNIILTHEGA